MLINFSSARTRNQARRLPLGLGISLLGAAALLGLSGCLTQEDKEVVPVAPDKAFVFTVTSDYKTGNYSVFGIDSSFTDNNIAAIHSDAVVRYLGGDDIFIINRLNRDNMQVVDRHNLKTVLQFAFPPLSNPQDVELKDSLVYVAFLGINKIGIYQESDGTAKGEIDLSAFADSSDKLAETSDLLFVGGDLYALTDNLDTKTPSWDPLTAHLLKIDPVSKKVVKSLELPYGNPAGMTYDSASGKIYIPCRGFYSNPDYSVKTDGGIVGIDLSKFAVTDTLATEKDLGGNVNQAHLYDGKLIMDIGADAGEKISAISLKDGTAQDIVDLDPYTAGGMAIDAKTGTLYLGDRKAKAERLRFFDLATFKEKDGSKVDLGAPPADMVVVR